MSRYVLHRDDLPAFVDALVKKYDVVAPVQKEDIVVYGEIESFDDVTLDYVNTRFPLRKYILPTPEDIFTYQDGTFTPTFDDTKRVLFGCRPCEVHAFQHQDQLFLEDGIVDPYYQKRRENNLLVCLQCWQAGENCFCESMGTGTVEDGFDLLICEIDEGYLVQTGSKAGEKLISHAKKLFKPTAKKADIQPPKCPKEVTSEGFEKLKDADNFHSPVWEKHAERCLSCCACTSTCPTCKCFGIRDLINLDLDSGTRVREQQSCQLKVFTKVAGEHVFREDRAKRLKHRIMHKFNYHAEKYGNQLCVGCGRCITNCPTDIDMTEIVAEI